MDFNKSIERFTDELVKLVIYPSHLGNVLFSPLSFSTALIILSTGAEEESLLQLQNVLNVDSSKQKNLENSISHILDYFRNNQAQEKLKIGNNLIVSQLLGPLPDCIISNIRSRYFANVDTANDGLVMRQKANNWIRLTTNGIVPAVIDWPSAKKFALNFFNCAYLTCNWYYTFWPDPYHTRFNSGHSIVKTTFFTRSEFFMYFEYHFQFEFKEEILRMIEIPFKGHIKLIAMFPPESVIVNQLVENIPLIQLLHQFEIRADRRFVELHMPKMNMHQTMDMMPILKNMGVTNIFEEEWSNLGNMSNPNVPRIYNLFVSEMDHVAVIHEEPDKASPVTLLSVKMIDPDVANPLQLILDRPFLYCIYDSVKHFPILIGKFMSPTPTPSGS